MCGLVGIAGGLEFKDEATMKRLLLLDYFRGPDSTGFAAIRDNGDLKMAKGSVNPLDLFDFNKFKDALSGSASKVFMGHNRAATRGAVNNVNAHPFVYDHIVGAHNGTLEYRDKYTLEEAVGEKFDVDSQAIFAGIAKLGIEETIKLMHEGRDYQTGAWALTWYDGNEGTINFLRNKHRPLFYAYDKEFKRLFWASEWAFIDAAARMSTTGYELFVEKSTGHQFWTFDPDVHYKFDVGTLKSGSSSRPKPKVKTIKGQEPVAAQTYENFPRPGTVTSSSGTQSQDQSKSETKTTSSTSLTTSRSPRHNTPADKIKIVQLVGDVKSPFAGYYNEEHFSALAKHGCSYCGKKIRFSDPSLTIYDRDGMILCSAHSGHGEVSPTVENPPATKIYLPLAKLEAMQ